MGNVLFYYLLLCSFVVGYYLDSLPWIVVTFSVLILAVLVRVVVELVTVVKTRRAKLDYDRNSF